MVKNKKWKRIVDNRMRGHGDIDMEKRVIRINKSKKANKKKGEIINSILHEEYHRKHPKATEKTTYKQAKKLEKKTSSKVKNKLYGQYRTKVVKHKVRRSTCK
jgi:hypothetical protein